MPTLTDCTPLLEVGFAVNAVAAAAQLYFRDTQREIARRLFADFKPADSTLSGAYAEHAFRQFVLEASPGLRMARAVYRWLIAAGLIALIISFVGLVRAAVEPDYPVAVTAVWAYGILCIILLPLLYWGYQRFLTWFEPAFTAKKTTQAERDGFWRSFELTLAAQETSQKLQELNSQVDEFILKMQWRQFRRWVDLLWERVRRLFRSTRHGKAGQRRI